eukprot:s2826_g1.t2
MHGAGGVQVLRVEEVGGRLMAGRRFGSKGRVTSQRAGVEPACAVRGASSTPDQVEASHAMNPLWKTRLCSFFSSKTGCRHGRLCTFAHGKEELRSAPDFTRTSICPELLRTGKCTEMHICPYAHNRTELRHAPGLMKTRMCDFHKTGTCMAKDLCRFAHQVEELSPAARAFFESSGLSPEEAESVPVAGIAEAGCHALFRRILVLVMMQPAASDGFCFTFVGRVTPGRALLRAAGVAASRAAGRRAGTKAEKDIGARAGGDSDGSTQGLRRTACRVSQVPVRSHQRDMAYKVLQDLQVRLAQMQSQSQSFDQLAQHAHQGPGLALSAQNASSESSDPWMQRRRQLSQELQQPLDCAMIEQSIMMLQRWGSLEPLARARLPEYLRKLPDPSADPRMLAGSSQAYGQDASLPRQSSFLPPGVEVSSGGAILPAPISPEEVDGQAASARPSGKQCFITSPGRAEATIPDLGEKVGLLPLARNVVKADLTRLHTLLNKVTPDTKMSGAICAPSLQELQR